MDGSDDDQIGSNTMDNFSGSENETPTEEDKQNSVSRTPRTSQFDDLFGSDVDSPVENDHGVPGEESERSQEPYPSSPLHPGDEFKEYETLTPMDDLEPEPEPEPFMVPFYRPPHGYDGKIYLAKLPNFLCVNPKRFDPNTYDEKEDISEIGGEVVSAENTMRWRYVRDEKTGELKKQSNSCFVRWSDGSVSLLLGEEIFDITFTSVADGHEYLMCNHDITKEDSSMEIQSKLTDKMSFRPFSTTGKTHRKVRESIASRHIKQVRTKLVETDQDPELLKREMEKLEKATRVKRRFGTSNRRDYAQSNRSGGGYRYKRDMGSDEDLRASRRGQRNDSYEDDTGFVANDEEVEEMELRREKRRRNAKSINKKKGKYKSESDTEEDYELEDDEDPGEVLDDDHDEVIEEDDPTPKEEDYNDDHIKSFKSADNDLSEEEEFRVVRKGKKKIKALASDEE
ncbi:hypothetical protein G9A89_018542 [Geosiphon pyriformis]|nr:hypothetical protein G9A89_018542 [Geosiphon pyriformis]